MHTTVPWKNTSIITIAIIIPINSNIRALNVSNSVAIMLFEVLRQQDYPNLLKEEPFKYYYTGKAKTFPSTVVLNKLYYFMPYIKGKGVRDLYLIRIARIGNKA